MTEPPIIASKVFIVLSDSAGHDEFQKKGREWKGVICIFSEWPIMKP